MTGCDPGGPSPYTPALEALGIDARGRARREPRDGRATAGPSRGDQGADRGRSRQPGARRRADGGHPARAVAAGRRRRGGRADPGRRGRDARQEHDGRLARPRARRGRRGSVGVRRGAPAGRADRRTAGHGPGRVGERVRRRGRRVRRQLRCLPAGHRRRDRRGMGPSGRLRRPGRGHRRVRGLAAADGRRVDAGRQHRRSGRRGRRRSPAGTLARASWRMRWSTPRPAAAATCAGSASGTRPPPARPARCLAGSSPPTPAGTTLEVHGLDPLAGATTIRLATAGRHNAANALAVAGAALSLGVAPERIAAGIASFGGVGRRLERKGEAAGVVVYDDYGHHPTAIARDARGRPPARARPARLGGLRAADLPSDRGHARRLRGGAGRRGRGRRRRHLGRPRS